MIATNLLGRVVRVHGLRVTGCTVDFTGEIVLVTDRGFLQLADDGQVNWHGFGYDDCRIEFLPRAAAPSPA